MDILNELKAQRDRLDRAISALEVVQVKRKYTRKNGKRTLSAAARKRISVAQKKRWKQRKKASGKK